MYECVSISKLQFRYHIRSIFSSMTKLINNDTFNEKYTVYYILKFSLTSQLFWETNIIGKIYKVNDFYCNRLHKLFSKY